MKYQFRVAAAAGLLLLAPAVLAQTPSKATRPRPDPQVFQQLLSDAYPADLVASKQGGDVEVTMCIDAMGAVSNVKLVHSSGYKALDDATLVVLPQSKWQPAHNAKGDAIAMCSPPFPLTVAWQPPNT